MIAKVITRKRSDDIRATASDHLYWMTKTSEERFEAVEIPRRPYHRGSASEIQPDFRNLLALFNTHKAEYLIAGGCALAFHGAPRCTGDPDIFINSGADIAPHRILPTGPCRQRAGPPPRDTRPGAGPGTAERPRRNAFGRGGCCFRRAPRPGGSTLCVWR